MFDKADLRDEWLHSPNPALGGERPIEIARTDAGACRVEAVLARIAWGDYG